MKKKLLVLCIIILSGLSFLGLVYTLGNGKETVVNNNKLMISKTVSDPEMIEINPTNDGYYYVVYMPEGSVYICHRWGRPERTMVPALHTDGTPVTAWDLSIAEELGLEAR